ncbi:DUF4388 domain-containing protein [Deinococcus sp. QL22]|uniref:DUF4388 domain-containing protein n=1 Tax=Deinococcus sp. QL22 TaxID=2939437 RepID=UPI002016EC7D|nr:DUF4388 domain-containing protein [Deinococcus sp. QL22]UQN05867.1 DUF4388 domain-containing protein [Deinococcus sp. QL22]
MTKSTSSLETFDFLELLYMLSESSKTGALSVHRPDGLFQCWLEQGRVRHLEFEGVEGVPALVNLLLDAQGRFHFDDGLTHPAPRLDATLDEVAFEALDGSPEHTPLFDGPARLPSPQRVAAMRWTLQEQDVLRQVEAQRPLSDLTTDPAARRMLAKLIRMGLLTPRKSRVARLNVTVTREVRGVVVIDDLILKRWKDDLVRPPQHIAIRDDTGKIHTLPVRGGLDLGAQLLIPTDLLMRTGLRAGDSVLVRPV